MNDITGLILAGGQGERMEKQDKGLLTLAGRHLIAHVIEVLAPQVSNIRISANRHLADYQTYGYEVLEDTSENDYEGPLAGLYRGMLEAGKEGQAGVLIMLVPCDAPFLAHDLVERLLGAQRRTNSLAVIAHDGTRRQPLFGLYSTDLLPDLQKFLESGGRKVGLWIDRIQPEIVDFSDEANTFLNINTPQDLSDAEKRLTAILDNI
jgi:molybdenum cofactor guanylyltransferase